jgi:uncharacterized protein YxjI
MSAAMYVPAFRVRQKITLMVNRYQIFSTEPDGAQGELLAFAEQKRLAFREQVTFYADESRSRPVFGFKARQRLDLGAGYDVTDESGQQIGFFRKDVAASLLRSTFHVEGPGYTGTGQERNMAVGLLRRFTDLSFLPVHFDFHDGQGRVLLTSQRRFSVGDRYDVTVPDQRVDFRVAAAVAVALDALLAR